jgi:Xaa-Pro aminopeptidase
MSTPVSGSPTIPAEEYADRWRRVQALLVERDLDLLVAYADDRATFGAAHARWLADFPVHFEPACILVPREGLPVMLVGPESDEYAQLRGRISDVRVLRELTHPDEDYPFSVIQGLGEIVDDLGLDPRSLRRVGLAGRGLIGAETLRAFEAALPGVEWVDVENAVCDLRAWKSPAEVAVVREAYRIADLGIEAAIEAVRPGVTERAVAAEIEAAMRRAGAEGTGIDTIVASGPNTRPILARSTFRPIAADDLVLLTVAPRYEGYHAAIGRLVLVGDPGQRVRDALEVAIRAQEACARLLRPGVEGRAVEAEGRRIVADAGLGGGVPLLGPAQRRRHRVRAAHLRAEQPGDAAAGHGHLHRHPHVQHRLGRAARGERLPRHPGRVGAPRARALPHRSLTRSGKTVRRALEVAADQMGSKRAWKKRR